MQLVNNKFNEITQEEMLMVEGGGLVEAAQVFAGTVLVAVSPAVAVGASIISTPVGGAVAGGGTAGLGLTLIGAGVH